MKKSMRSQKCIQKKTSIWSVDRIARLIVGICNSLLGLAIYFISPYFLIGLCLFNFNLIFTSLTDKCVFKQFLLQMGARERESFFYPSGKLMPSSFKNRYLSETTPFQNNVISLTNKERK